LLNTTKYLFVWSSAIPIIEGVCFGIIISLACGVYPAWKAANLIPIEAMRHE
jgi:putative ABC transport system permease protein